MAEVQKQQAISGANVEYEKAKSEFEKDRMQLQAQLDQQKMMQQQQEGKTGGRFQTIMINHRNTSIITVIPGKSKTLTP